MPRIFLVSLLTVLALGGITSIASADDRFALIVEGVSGSEKIAQTQQKWVASLQTVLKSKLGLAGDHVVALTETGSGAAASTRAGVIAALTALRGKVTADDTLMIVLIGHGTADDKVAKFNLVGPDMDTLEWRHALEGIPARIIFVDTTSASFPFVKDLAAKNRIVIAATDSVAQHFDTMFPEYFIEALDKVAAADSDKNNRLSVWEAFAYASQAVKLAFNQKGTLVTERAVIDDTGEGVGKEAAAATTGAVGVLARTTFLDAGPVGSSSNPAVAALEKQRISLEAQIEQLKGRKDQMPPADYDAQLERLAIDLARVSAQLRSLPTSPAGAK